MAAQQSSSSYSYTYTPRLVHEVGMLFALLYNVGVVRGMRDGFVISV